MGIVPSPTLVFDKNGAPGRDGQATNIVEYWFDATVSGACCTVSGCLDLTAASCAATTEGTYLGDGTPCAGTDTNSDGHDDACDHLFPIPALSDWGLIILTLLTLTTATMILSHRRTAT